MRSRYRFAHALIQHSLYDELSPTRRQRAHQRVAEGLEAQATTEDAATLAEFAHHWVAATRPADLDKALGYVRRAGDAARDALAPDDAIRWYQQALDLICRQDHRRRTPTAELLAELGTVQRQAGHPEYRETLLRSAPPSPNDSTTPTSSFELGARLQQCGGSGSRSATTDAKRVVTAALDRIGPDPTPTRARLLAALADAHDA